MGALQSYDPDELNTDVLKLSLAKASRKYKNWDRHEDGARIFGILTLTIAIREILNDNAQQSLDIKEDLKFLSRSEIYDRFNAARRMDSSLDKSLVALLQHQCFGSCLSDELRVFTVRHHACGWTTSQVLDVILPVDVVEVELTPLQYYAIYYGMRQHCRDYLSRQLNYLKRGNPRWPKKYDAVWDEARAEFLKNTRDIPLTHISEQIQALSAHYAKLTDAYDALPSDPEYSRDRAVLTRAMTQTMSGLYALTRDPALPKPSQDALGQTENMPVLAAPVTVNALPATEDEAVSDAQTIDTENVDA